MLSGALLVEMDRTPNPLREGLARARLVRTGDLIDLPTARSSSTPAPDPGPR